MLTVRFSEFERYDINLDCEVVQFLATTGTGSFFAEVPVDRTTPSKRREFKERVIELMQQKAEPGWIDFADTTEA